ncbi:MAG TPA: potassium transporter TrkA [Thermoanaerobaculia bacterium]|jgi:voltage-gated potassium channel Kch|nr:potassium transporter TrkA [Thermoanaerobaculia bacterium]
MNGIRWTHRARYGFDNVMSRGTPALIALLALASLALIMIAALVMIVLHVVPGGADGTPDFAEGMWLSLMRTLDSGTMGGDEGRGFRVTMLFVTLGGIFIVSALIGVLNSGLEGKLDELRKGRSFVIEKDHTLILGWSPKIFTVLSELVLANENRHKPRIVILAEKDKIEMEDEIRDEIGGTGKTKIICRTGSPLNLNDLEIVNPHQARSIVVLAPESEDPDPEVIKTILAITNNPNRREEPYHIVAELAEPRNVEVAKMVGKDEAELIVTGDLIPRIIVQTSRQSGLSVVYTELLDFGGDEIYFQEEPKLVGKTFGEALLAYEESAIMGLRKREGAILLNPPMDTRIEAGDKVIAISEDDDTVRVSDSAPQIDERAIHAAAPSQARPERTLLLGWNERGPAIVHELDRYVAPGSELTLVADVPGIVGIVEQECGDLERQKLTCREADTKDRRVLDALGVESYDQIILLCYSDQLDVQEADARTLITLLHLRDMAEKGGHDFRIVSEMLDVRNRELAEVTQADDFIVSNKLTSLMLSQISENKELNVVFADVFDPEGSEIYLKPAADYVSLGVEVNFYTVVEAARRRGEVAIGYRQLADAKNAEKSYGVVVNPKKSETVALTKEDQVIVLAED